MEQGSAADVASRERIETREKKRIPTRPIWGRADLESPSPPLASHGRWSARTFIAVPSDGHGVRRRSSWRGTRCRATGSSRSRTRGRGAARARRCGRPAWRARRHRADGSPRRAARAPAGARGGSASASSGRRARRTRGPGPAYADAGRSRGPPACDYGRGGGVGRAWGDEWALAGLEPAVRHVKSVSRAHREPVFEPRAKRTWPLWR